MKASDTKPEFAGTDDDVREEIPSRPIRDPSLDGLLIGLEERLDQPYSSGAKLRVHTPPNAHTDPFPEEPVVAPNLTAPLSAVVAEKIQARGRVKAASATGELARLPRPLDPTYVLDREPTMTRRAWMIVGACGVVVVAALGVAVWAATAGHGEPPTATAAPAAEAPLSATLPSLPLAALPSAGVASALVVSPAPAASASGKSAAPHAQPGKPNSPAGARPTAPGEIPFDRRLD